MAHPMKPKCSDARDNGRARYRAEGGRINPSTGAPSRPLSSTKSEMDVPGPSSGTYQTRMRMERRMRDVDSDDDIKRVVRDAGKAGVDWSSHLK